MVSQPPSSPVRTGRFCSLIATSESISENSRSQAACPSSAALAAPARLPKKRAPRSSAPTYQPFHWRRPQNCFCIGPLTSRSRSGCGPGFACRRNTVLKSGFLSDPAFFLYDLPIVLGLDSTYCPALPEGYPILSADTYAAPSCVRVTLTPGR